MRRSNSRITIGGKPVRKRRKRAVEHDAGHFPVTRDRVLAGRRLRHAAERAARRRRRRRRWSPPAPARASAASAREAARRARCCRACRCPRRRTRAASGSSPTPTESMTMRMTRIERRHQAELKKRRDQVAGASLRRRRLAGAFEPPYVRLFAEPDQLAARVAHVLADDELARGGLVAHAVQQLDDLPVDEAAERVRRCRHAGGQQAVAPRRRRRARTARRRGAPRARAAPGAAGRAPIVSTRSPAIGDVGLGEVRRQRPAGQQIDLERANEPLAIARLDAARRLRIDARQPAMQRTRRRAASATRSSRARSSSSRAGPGNRPRTSAR